MIKYVVYLQLTSWTRNSSSSALRIFAISRNTEVLLNTLGIYDRKELHLKGKYILKWIRHTNSL